MTDDGQARTFEHPGISVPVQVGPYFMTGLDDPVMLGEYAESAGLRVPRQECAQWTRLGGDGGFELCADPEGAVWAVLLDFDEPNRFVSSCAEAFAGGLAEAREALRVILSTDRPQEASAAFDRLGERLRTRDPRAFAERESWWPLVLDDIHDTAAAASYAAFEYVDGMGAKQIVTQSGGIALHPEERLWNTLRAAGVEPDQVLRIHTDLAPCFLPGHYCSLWMAQVFPDAQLTHHFPYGESAASRAEGIRLLGETAGADR
ncbi:nucleic acid/nucleotide deaminase domain-containing protein [Streptomyces sp. cg28]|uniref:nucleic acid/nucleotide deaminase domain-containing protein n=1 Tax=Streptomyces sp. cg28 TaxID=3403457 RepID=UPI003B213989